MKLKSFLIERQTNNIDYYSKDEFVEELENLFERLSERLSDIFVDYFKEKNPSERSIAASFDKYLEDLLNEAEGRSSVRMTILNKAFNGKVKFTKPSVNRIPKEEKDNIIEFLIENKKGLKYQSLGQDKFGIKEASNRVIDDVFKKSVLEKLFKENDKVLFYVIMGEIKKRLSEDIVNSKSFKLNIEKRISELDLTFIGTLKKGNLKKEPNDIGTFPDYEYKFSGEDQYDGEEDLKRILKDVGIPGTHDKVYIEMKGDKSPRIVSTQTSPKAFFNELGKDLSKRIKNLELNKDIDLNKKEVRNFIKAANLEYAFSYPILYVKSARSEVLGFYLFGRGFENFKLKRLKKSLSLYIETKAVKGARIQKAFSVEFTSKAYEEIFG